MINVTTSTEIVRWVVGSVSVVERPLEHRTLVAVDFEFTRLPLPTESMSDWLRYVSILSVGCSPIAAPDAGWYGTMHLSSYLLRQCSAFVNESVIPARSAAEPDGEFKFEDRLASALLSYFARTRRALGKPIAAVSTYGGDHMLLRRLLGDYCPDIYFPSPAVLIPSAPDLIEHNALCDAKALARGIDRHFRSSE